MLVKKYDVLPLTTYIVPFVTIASIWQWLVAREQKPRHYNTQFIIPLRHSCVVMHLCHRPQNGSCHCMT